MSDTYLVISFFFWSAIEPEQNHTSFSWFLHKNVSFSFAQ